MDSPLLVFYKLLTVLQTINRSVDHRLGPYYFKEIFMSYLIIASCSGKDKVAVAFTMPMTLYVILFWTQLPSKQQFWCEYVHILNSLGFQDISVVCQCFSSNMEGESFLCIFWLTKTWPLTSRKLLIIMMALRYRYNSQDLPIVLWKTGNSWIKSTTEGSRASGIENGTFVKR